MLWPAAEESRFVKRLKRKTLALEDFCPSVLRTAIGEHLPTLGCTHYAQPLRHSSVAEGCQDETSQIKKPLKTGMRGCCGARALS